MWEQPGIFQEVPDRLLINKTPLMSQDISERFRFEGLGIICMKWYCGLSLDWKYHADIPEHPNMSLQGISLPRGTNFLNLELPGI